MLMPTFLIGQTKLDSLIFQNINLYRTSVGLNTLVFSKQAFESASLQTDSMYRTQHRVNDGTIFKFGHFYKNYEVCNFLIGFVTNDETLDKLAEQIVQNWKGSKSHNNILLDANISKMGVSSKHDEPRVGHFPIILGKPGLVYMVYSTAVFLK